MSYNYPSKNIFIGKRYVPKVIGDWDNSKNTSYEALSVVLYGGDSYTSKQDVPKGIDITNVLFWVKSSNYNAQIATLQSTVQQVSTMANGTVAEVDESRGGQATLKGRLDDVDKRIKNSVTIDVSEYPTIGTAFANIQDNTTILFPAGTYSDVYDIPQILNRKNIRIIGYGAEIRPRILKNSSSDGSLYVTPFNLSGCDNVSFEGIKINGGFTVSVYQQTTTDTTNNCKLVKADACTRLKFKDCTFTGHATNRVTSVIGSDAGVVITNGDNVTFRDCKYNDNWMEGIWLESTANIVIDNLNAVNSNIWTTLDIFKCKNVNITNSYVYARNGVWDDTATLNIYGSNIRIHNNTLMGGSGLDFSDEANYCGTQEDSIFVDNCYISAKYGFHISGDKYATNVRVDRCKIDANYGFYYYMYQNRHINNLRVTKSNFNVINALRVRCLGQTPIFENVYFKDNVIFCKNLADSQVYDNTLSSMNGGSSPFVITGTTGATSGTEIVRDIHFLNNEIHAEGSYINVYTPVAFIVKDIEFRNNKCFNHDYNLTILNDRGIYVNAVTRFTCRDNELHNTKNNNIWGCTDLFIESNEVIFDGTTQSTRIWYLYSNTGYFIGRDNYCNTSVMEHFQGNSSYANTWTAYILRDNLPATYTSITAN